MSGLANNCSITTLYVLYATTLWKDPYSSYTPTSRINPLDLVSGLAFISPLCIHASPLYFGGHDYRPHGSLATADTRSSVLLSYTLRPSNRHYFPSKSFSPSSQIHHPRKEEPYLRCSWPMNSPMKPPHRLILSVPRVLDAFCKT